VVVHGGGSSYKASLDPVGIFADFNKPLLPAEWLGKRVRVMLAE
jgi:hypothetical protein